MAISDKFRRIHITMDPDVDAALTKIAALQGRPVATVIREVLRQAAPAFAVMAEALAIADEQPKKAAKKMVEVFDRTVAEAHQTTFPLRRKPGRPRK